MADFSLTTLPSGRQLYLPNTLAAVGSISGALDGISSTRGTVLYRGASAWAGLAPGTAGLFLRTNGAGSDPSWNDPEVNTLTIDTTATDVVNTKTLTTVFSFTIPAGTIGPSGFLELVMSSDYLNNTGFARGLRFRVRLGGTTTYDYTTPSNSFNSSASRRVSRMIVEVYNLGAENSNLTRVGFDQSFATTIGTVTTGVGGFGSSQERLGFTAGSLPTSIDTSVDAVLDVAVQHSFASASLSFRQQYSVLRKTA